MATIFAIPPTSLVRAVSRALLWSPELPGESTGLTRASTSMLLAQRESRAAERDWTAKMRSLTRKLGCSSGCAASLGRGSAGQRADLAAVSWRQRPPRRPNASFENAALAPAVERDIHHRRPIGVYEDHRRKAA